MGGQAFALHNPPLPTPRMPTEVFNFILESTLKTLREHYSHVESPIEAPGKTTYGDIDVLVTGARVPEYDPASTPWNKVAEGLAGVLGAVASIRHSGQSIVNLAIPWPERPLGTGMQMRNIDADSNEVEEPSEDKYIQIDIHHLHSPERFQWELFHSSHGDMWNILGSTIRRFGLTVNDRGLYLRIPEIELFDRKKSMIFLTEKPSEVLDFVGLDESPWWKPFVSQSEMFDYAASCRLFWVRGKGEEEEYDVVGDLSVGGQEGGEAGKKKLKHNDRQRMSKRPIFNAWISEFIPACREAGLYIEQKATREEVRDQAFEKFGVKNEYEEKLAVWKLSKHKDDITREAIKDSIPFEDVDPQFRAASIKTIKAVVMDGQEFEGSIPEAVKHDEDGFYDKAAVKAFVEANWEKAGRIGMERQHAKAVQGMKEKEEKKKRLAEEDAKKQMKLVGVEEDAKDKVKFVGVEA